MLQLNPAVDPLTFEVYRYNRKGFFVLHALHLLASSLRGQLPDPGSILIMIETDRLITSAPVSLKEEELERARAPST